MNKAALQPAIFLDRDGVLNRVILHNGLPGSPATLDELDIPPDVPGALAELRDAGFSLVVVTNQPDVARGMQSREMVDMLNDAIMSRLPLDEMRVCYHDDTDGCACRKPMPGLLLREPAHDMGRSFMVGDRWRDIEAGKAAKVRATILVESGHIEPLRSEPDFKAATLSEAVGWILRKVRM